MMTSNDTKTTVGKTFFYQGESHTHPLFCIATGIPCQSAREQASELMGLGRYAPHRQQGQLPQEDSCSHRFRVRPQN